MSELPNSSTQLYCGNLPFSLTTEELKEAFESFGILTDGFVASRNNRPRGFGFVTFKDATAATKACVAVNGTCIGGDKDGRPIRVTFARVRPNSNDKQRRTQKPGTRKPAHENGNKPETTATKTRRRRRPAAKEGESSEKYPVQPSVQAKGFRDAVLGSTQKTRAARPVKTAPPPPKPTPQPPTAVQKLQITEPTPKADDPADALDAPFREYLSKKKTAPPPPAGPLQDLDLAKAFGSGAGSLTVKHVPLLAQYLKHATNLRTLNLSSNGFGTRATTVVSRGMMENKSVTSLDLSYNNIGPAGVATIANLLGENSKLKQLNLSFNPLTSKGSLLLANALKKNTTLTTLQLERTLDTSASHLASMLKDNNTLTHLDIGRSLFNQAEGALQIAASIKSNFSIRILKLGRTGLGPAGTAAVAGALVKNRSITELDLHFNKMGVTGAAKVAEMLAGNNVLRHLNLQYNLLGPQGTAHIVAALMKNKSLQFLNIGYNLIKDEGAALVSQLMQANKSLHVNFEENFIGDKLIAKLEGLSSQREMP